MVVDASTFLIPPWAARKVRDGEPVLCRHCNGFVRAVEGFHHKYVCPDCKDRTDKDASQAYTGKGIPVCNLDDNRVLKAIETGALYPANRLVGAFRLQYFDGAVYAAMAIGHCDVEPCGITVAEAIYCNVTNEWTVTITATQHQATFAINVIDKITGL